MTQLSTPEGFTVSLLDTGKDLRRANTLITILLKYGLADVVRRVGLAPLLEQASRLVRQPADRELLSMSPPQRLREIGRASCRERVMAGEVVGAADQRG